MTSKRKSITGTYHGLNSKLSLHFSTVFVLGAVSGVRSHKAIRERDSLWLHDGDLDSLLLLLKVALSFLDFGLQVIYFELLGLARVP